MTNIIELFLTSFMPNSVNTIFILSIIILFSLGIYWLINHKYTPFVNYIPSLLTSLGILGTFVGISIGLVNFDPTNIDESISKLLEGMKTAFYSSLVGMLFSIVFKIITSIYANRNQEKLEDDEKLLYVLEKQTDAMEHISKILGGDADTSILNQMKLYKSDMGDYIRYTKEYNEKFAENLWGKLEKFADILSKSATEIIIQALNDVIKDFNNNLTEQFGDNFKQLNNAVFELVKWQEQYKDQIELWQKNYEDHKSRIDKLSEQQQYNIELLTNTADTVKEIEQSIGKISEHTNSIPDNMEKLSDIMDIHEKQLNDLDNHLQAFAEMKDKASNAFPEIKENVDLIIDSIKHSVENTTNYYNNLLLEMEKIQETVSNQINSFIEDTNGKINNLSNIIVQKVEDNVDMVTNKITHSIENTTNHYDNLLLKVDGMQEKVSNAMNLFIKEANEKIHNLSTVLSQKMEENVSNVNKIIENNLNDMLTSQNKGIDMLFSKIDTTLQEQVSKTEESINRQVKIIDESMEQELKRGLEAIGKALAQISAKVVEEYNKMYEANNN